MIKEINVTNYLLEINNEIRKLEQKRAKKNTSKYIKSSITKKINLLRRNIKEHFEERKKEYPNWMVSK